MGACCVAQAGPPDVACDIPVIYGDYFDRETRILIALCQFAGEPF